MQKKVVGIGYIFKDEEEILLIRQRGLYSIGVGCIPICVAGHSLIKDKDKETIEFTFRCRNCGEKWSQDIPYYGEDFLSFARDLGRRSD